MAQAEYAGGKPAEKAANLKWRYYSPIQKDYVTFLKTSEETGGEYTLIEVEFSPGGGNIPHFHKTYDEHLEVLEGTLEVLVDKENRTLGPGGKAVAPKNALHCFRSATEEPVRFLVELRPGHSGFEKTIKVAYGLAGHGRTFSDGTPKNLYHLAILLGWSEIRLPGVFTLAEPLFRLLARRARRKGIDRELEAKYCRQQEDRRPGLREEPGCPEREM